MPHQPSAPPPAEPDRAGAVWQAVHTAVLQTPDDADVIDLTDRVTAAVTELGIRPHPVPAADRIRGALTAIKIATRTIERAAQLDTTPTDTSRTGA